jgi:hypothetical protein
MPLADKIMLRKRFVIEAVLSCLVAYAFRPGKPSVSLTRQHIEAYP